MVSCKLIEGSQFDDERGKLNFFNTFNMSDIIRMYEIIPKDTSIIRGWQAHKEEKKWFYCNSGAFIINLIKIDDFEIPSNHLSPKQFLLDAENPMILGVSGGYATAFKASAQNSKLLVFSNFTLERSKQDDFRYPLSKWSGKW